MNIQHLGLLDRMKKYLAELIETTAPRGPMCMLDRDKVARCSSSLALLLLTAIQDLDAEIEQKLAARKST
jgi:hypothetical protein